MKIVGLFFACKKSRRLWRHPLLGLALSVRPVLRQVDVIHQLPQPPLIATVGMEHQARQMAEPRFVMVFAPV